VCLPCCFYPHQIESMFLDMENFLSHLVELTVYDTNINISDYTSEVFIPSVLCVFYNFCNSFSVFYLSFKHFIFQSPFHVLVPFYLFRLLLCNGTSVSWRLLHI
jgi:hypothetical protein